MKMDLFDKKHKISVRSGRLCCQGSLYCERFDFAGVGMGEDYTRSNSEVHDWAVIQREERKRRGASERSVLYETAQ